MTRKTTATKPQPLSRAAVQWLTREEAIALSADSRARLDKAIAAGLLRAYRRGRSIRIRLTDLHEYLEAVSVPR